MTDNQVADSRSGAFENGSHDDQYDQLALGVVVTAATGEILDLNSSAEAIFDLSRDALVGRPLTDVNKDLHDLALRALYSDGALTHRALQLGPGHARYDCTFTPTVYHGRRAIMGELYCVDWHLRVLRSESRVSEQSAMKELMRGLAHEVKNPLGGIRGAAQLLRKRLSDLDLREFADVIIAEADRLSALVDRFSKPTGSLTANTFAELNFHEVLERVIKLVESDHGSNIEVERNYDPSLPMVTGSKDRLIQAVLNLALNAVQAGATKLELRTRVERHCVIGHQTHPMGMRFDLSDNGTGVPEEIREVIFYPMVSGRADGSGLGLNQAQSTVVDHGGVITYQSQPGHTIFTLRLPFQESRSGHELD